MSSTAISHAAPAARLTAQVATQQVFFMASNNQLAATLAVPGALALEAKKFKVRAEGSVYIAAAATTAKPVLLAALTVPSSPLTPGNWTQLATGTGEALAAAGWAPWWIEADVIFDSQSGILMGTFNEMVAGTPVANAALSNQLIGINGSNQPVLQGSTTVPPTNPALYLAVSLQFSVAGLNVGNLANFEIGF